MSTVNATLATSVNRVDLLFQTVKMSFPTLLNMIYANGVAFQNLHAAGSVLSFVFSDNQTANATQLQTIVSAYSDPLINPYAISVLSTLNSTTATIAANGTYTGAFDTVNVYASITITIACTAPGTLTLQFGALSPQVDVTKTYPITASSYTYVITTVSGQYLRVLFNNGAAAQTSFALATYLSTQQQLPIGTAGDVLTDTSSVAVSRALTTARYESNLYGPVRLNETNELRVTSSNSTGRAISRTPVLQLNFSYGVNPSTNVTTGTVTSSSGKAVVSTTGTNSTSSLSSYRIIQLAAGNTVSVYVSCAFAPGVAGLFQYAGCGTAANGLFVGYNGVNFGVCVRSAGAADVWTYAPAFSVDPINGTGRSGATITPQNGNSFMIQYDAFGFGSVVFSWMQARSSLVFHTVTFGAAGAIGLSNAQFPLLCTVANTTNAAAAAINVASMAAFTDVLVTPLPTLQRSVDVTGFASSTVAPLLVMQNKSTFNTVLNTASVKVQSISVNSAFQGQTLQDNVSSILLTFIEFPVLTGATFTDVDTGNSVLAISRNATAVSGGHVVYELCFTDGDSVQDLGDQNIYLSPGFNMCLACSTATASRYLVTVAVTLQEFQ
jgi:hypothetical protein